MAQKVIRWVVKEDRSFIHPTFDTWDQARYYVLWNGLYSARIEPIELWIPGIY